MTVISSTEFATNQNKYFDMAMEEEVFVQRGNNMFLFKCTDKYEEPDMIFEPDEDFYRSISKEELLKGIHEDIDNFFANK